MSGFFLPGVMLSRFIHVVAYNTSLFLMTEKILLYGYKILYFYSISDKAHDLEKNYGLFDVSHYT